MTPYEERLTDDIRTALRTALQILERDTGRHGKPCPNAAQVSAVRTQVFQAAMWSAELYGAMAQAPAEMSVNELLNKNRKLHSAVAVLINGCNGMPNALYEWDQLRK
ncbi:hypothetical protein UFOVP1254_20 [uncultured Caudovirales phage]|uniref:Uncharacterized protein n=1 Tax=uncultured Caudovirales phage TaxID=2100421 RepID=A0A6J5RPW0_9CAUD|nr:hypothetical protein UFOVP1254_20 [uncultured Caudovirales phage]